MQRVCDHCPYQKLNSPKNWNRNAKPKEESRKDKEIERLDGNLLEATDTCF